jgi:hypothetical protein
VLRDESLWRMSFWIGRTGEEGVALRSRRCDCCLCGGLARTKLFLMELALSLKLPSVSYIISCTLEAPHTCQFFLWVAVWFS